jgi:large subunit ribosomal protein L3
MLNSILGTKIDQTQKYTSRGKRIPVTRIQAGPCPVVQIKTKEKDGYLAIQLGLGSRRKAKKPLAGHLKKAKITTPPLFLQEIRLQESEEKPSLEPGEVITVDKIFKPGDIVDIIGTSKGKGFAGVVKRWGFAGGSRTHGQSDRERAPGSIGAGTTPGRVWKGKKMAGHLGHQRTTIRNLQVFAIEPQENLLLIKGLVPGPRGGFLIIKKIGEGKLEAEIEAKPEERGKPEEEVKKEEPKEKEVKSFSATSDAEAMEVKKTTGG